MYNYNERIFLTPEDILNKEFKIDARGFRPQEVDKFLDIVIRDYTEFIAMTKKLEKEVATLTDENTRLKNELRKLKSNIAAAESISSNNGQINNVDLLRRLSQLEKVVFGKNE